MDKETNKEIHTPAALNAVLFGRQILCECIGDDAGEPSCDGCTSHGSDEESEVRFSPQQSTFVPDKPGKKRISERKKKIKMKTRKEHHLYRK